MSRAGFKPAIKPTKGPQTYALASAVTGTYVLDAYNLVPGSCKQGNEPMVCKRLENS
jgi:hypothetical protein